MGDAVTISNNATRRIVSGKCRQKNLDLGIGRAAFAALLVPTTPCSLPVRSGETDETISQMRTSSLRKLMENNRLLFRMLIGGVIICAAWFLLFVPSRQQTLSIVVKPCGNDTPGRMKSEDAGTDGRNHPFLLRDPPSYRRSEAEGTAEGASPSRLYKDVTSRAQA